MGLNKKTFPKSAAAAPFDPLQNFETVTYTGNGSTQKITGYIRKGGAFNGSTSHIDIPSPIPYTNTDLSFGCWFNLSSAFSSGFQTLIGAGDKTTGEGIIRVLLRYSSANSYTIEPVRSYGGNAYYSATSNYTAQTINAGTWYHILYTYDATGSTAKIYLNGSLISTTNLTTTSTDATNTDVLALGQYRDSSSAFNWNGKIDQVRIFNTAITDTAKIAQLAAEDYTKATKSTTDIFGDGSGVALYELDEDAVSSNFGQAASFNGSSSKIETSLTQTNTSAWSWSLWAYISAKPSTGNISEIISNMNGSSPFAGVSFIIDSPYFGIGSGGSNIWTTNQVNPNLNQWYHIAVTYDGVNTITPYINGTSYGGITHSPSNGNQITIGDGDVTSWTPFNGLIDQVRIYSSTLSSTDVANLYAESNVPTANLVAHYKLDGDATDETGSYDGTASNVTYTTGVYGGTPTNVNFLGMAFQPDLVWIKSRTNPLNGIYHTIMDSVRGQSNGFYKSLFSNTTDYEDNISGSSYTQAVNGGVSSFDSNGFTLSNGSSGGANDDLNVSSYSYVAWCWKAGGAAALNEEGSINSQVSANQAAGFSIVKHIGTGGVGTVGHGLSQPPELIIYKQTSSSAVGKNWVVYASPLGNTKGLVLNLPASAFTDADAWNNTSPTSTVFSLGAGDDNYGTQTNVSGSSNIAYCFHSVDEYQKVGSYSGGTSGIQVTTGFKPRFVMLKNITTSGDGWCIFDTIRSGDTIQDDILFPNLSNSESVNNANVYINVNSTGFTVANTYSISNGSGNTYIYLAIA